MANLYSPTGSRIVATRDIVYADAAISDGSAHNTAYSGKFDFEYAGGSTINWDSQVTEELEGERLFVDEDGDVWSEDVLELKEETDNEC